MSILRSNSEGLIPVEKTGEIITGVVSNSAVMSVSRLEPMANGEKIVTVGEGVNAFFVDEAEAIGVSEDAQLKPIKLVAKKLAVIIPFSNEFLNESIVDVVTALQPEIVKEFYKKFDGFAVNKLMTEINNTGNFVTEDDTPRALYEDVSDIMALVEAGGYEVNGFVAPSAFKNRIRKMKDLNGNALYTPKGVAGEQDQLYAQPIGYNNAIDKSKVQLIAGDFASYSLVGMQEEMQYKVLDQATVGSINLATQDMSALRVIMPVAYEVAKDDAFSALKPNA